MRFEKNGLVDNPSSPWLWTLLFGSFYFLYKGIWTHFVLSAILAMFTMGFSWLIYPFFANGIVRRHYIETGWRELEQ